MGRWRQAARAWISDHAPSGATAALYSSCGADPAGCRDSARCRCCLGAGASRADFSRSASIGVCRGRARAERQAPGSPAAKSGGSVRHAAAQGPKPGSSRSLGQASNAGFCDEQKRPPSRWCCNMLTSALPGMQHMLTRDAKATKDRTHPVQGMAQQRDKQTSLSCTNRSSLPDLTARQTAVQRPP